MSAKQSEKSSESDLLSSLDEIRGDLGFDAPKDLREKFLYGEQLNLKWNAPGVTGQMHLCVIGYSLIRAMGSMIEAWAWPKTGT